MNSCNPTVFVIEDDPVVCNSIDALVSSMSFGCQTFTTAERFLDHFDPLQPGCAVIDLYLEGKLNGLELQKHLARYDYNLPVVSICGCLDIPLAVRAMQSGAVTVLKKPCDDEQLAEAICHAVDISRERLGSRLRRSVLQARLDSLDSREHEMMSLIVKGMPNKSIARDMGISHRTAARIRSILFNKMGAETAVHLVRIAVELGIIKDLN